MHSFIFDAEKRAVSVHGSTAPFIFTSYLRDLSIALDYGVNRF